MTDFLLALSLPLLASCVLYIYRDDRRWLQARAEQKRGRS